MLVGGGHMVLQSFLIAGFLAAAQAPPGPTVPAPLQAAPAAAPSARPGDPFYLPPEAKEFAWKASANYTTDHQKMQGILRAMFRAKADGGMGLVYDNSRTRTVAEVWQEGKANCLSMTAFYVMACRAMKIPSTFAEALNTNHYRKVGSVVRYELHVVALLSVPIMGDLIADFVPELRKRFGVYMVAVIPETRFRALFYSNRAVEVLGDGDLETAQSQAQLSLAADPTCGAGWNTLGVVREALEDPAGAEEAYRHAMALDPRDGAPLGNLEALMKKAGRLEEAAKFQVLAEKVRRKDPFFHATLAEEALQAGDLREAESRARMALKLMPKEPDFHLLLARVKLAAGDLDAATKGIEEAKRLSDPAERARFDGKLSYINGLQGEKRSD